MSRVTTKTVTVTTIGDGYMRKIAPDQLPVIKALHEDAGWPMTQIADKYGVSRTRISQILKSEATLTASL